MDVLIWLHPSIHTRSVLTCSKPILVILPQTTLQALESGFLELCTNITKRFIKAASNSSLQVGSVRVCVRVKGCAFVSLTMGFCCLSDYCDICLSLYTDLCPPLSLHPEAIHQLTHFLHYLNSWHSLNSIVCSV